MSEFARPFRVTYADGYTLDGVQFPSGHCVLDSAQEGLVGAGLTFEHLAKIHLRPGAVVEWADGGGQP